MEKVTGQVQFVVLLAKYCLWYLNNNWNRSHYWIQIIQLNKRTCLRRWIWIIYTLIRIAGPKLFNDLMFLKINSNNTEAFASELLENSWRNDFKVLAICLIYSSVKPQTRMLSASKWLTFSSLYYIWYDEIQINNSKIPTSEWYYSKIFIHIIVY